MQQWVLYGFSGSYLIQVEFHITPAGTNYQLFKGYLVAFRRHIAGTRY